MNNFASEVRCFFVKVIDNSFIIDSMTKRVNDLDLLMSQNLTSQEALDRMMFIVLRFYMHIINSLKSLWRVFCNVKRIRLLLFLIYNVIWLRGRQWTFVNYFQYSVRLGRMLKNYSITVATEYRHSRAIFQNLTWNRPGVAILCVRHFCRKMYLTNLFISWRL